MKRFAVASVFAVGIGFLVSQAVRTPIYAASGFQASTQSNQQTPQQQSGQSASPVKGETAAASTSSHPDLSKAGGDLFVQNCAFCHGRDAMGGETGPDLTLSKLVIADVGGDKISEVIRDGRPQKGMPSFNFSNEEMLSVVAFIHDQEKKAAAHIGGRRGVDVSDLQTCNVEKG